MKVTSFAGEDKRSIFPKIFSNNGSKWENVFIISKLSPNVFVWNANYVPNRFLKKIFSTITRFSCFLKLFHFVKVQLRVWHNGNVSIQNLMFFKKLLPQHSAFFWKRLESKFHVFRKWKETKHAFLISSFSFSIWCFRQKRSQNLTFCKLSNSKADRFQEIWFKNWYVVWFKKWRSVKFSSPNLTRCENVQPDNDFQFRSQVVKKWQFRFFRIKLVGSTMNRYWNTFLDNYVTAIDDCNTTAGVWIMNFWSEKMIWKNRRTLLLALTNRKNKHSPLKRNYLNQGPKKERFSIWSRYELVENVWEQHLRTLENVSWKTVFNNNLLL